MSLATNVSNLATRIATEVKSIRTLVNGNESNLAALNTTAKANLVAAINELVDDIANLDVSGQVAALIDDTTTSTSKVWSSSKTDSEIQAAVAALVDGAPALLDTLNELAAALGDDANFAASVTSAIAAAQTAAETFATAAANAALADAEDYADAKDAALRTEIGDMTTNYVTTFEAGLL